MILRDIIVVEKNLTPAELIKHGGKYLRTLIDLVDADKPLPIDPEYRSRFTEPYAVINKEEIPVLKAALDDPDIKSALPKKVRMSIDGKEQEQPLSLLFKGTEFTSLEQKKDYNAGHLAELFMGLCVAAKFFALDEKIRADQIMDMIGHVNSKVDGKNYVFTISSNIQYPDRGAKIDTLNFLARIPARSAEAFLKQAAARKFDSDLQAVLSSTIKYVNDSATVKQSTERVRNDKNNNHIDVVSDGTSDAKGTKADLTLKVDGTKVNLLSLKTYSSDTLGQASGLSFENLSKWFKTNFDLNIDAHKDQFDPAQGEDTVYNNLLKFYDTVVFPYVEERIENQRPGAEAEIVKQLARAANIYARGDTLEDVEVVKLDDKISSGSYKILRFSDNLQDAMKHLDLDVRYINKGNSRTIQIWTVPAEGEQVAKGSNKLCQFRTTKMGGYARNYFESGPMLEALTAVNTPADSETTPSGVSKTVTSTTRELK